MSPASTPNMMFRFLSGSESLEEKVIGLVTATSRRETRGERHCFGIAEEVWDGSETGSGRSPGEADPGKQVQKGGPEGGVREKSGTSPGFKRAGR